MKRSLLACAAALALAGSACTDNEREPDNTAANTRDQDGGTLTAFDQGESDADRQITAKVRELVVADDALSTNAQNVKIITVAGVVTLRGPVENAAEKASIESKARSVAGVSNVTNQLETRIN